MSCVSFVGFELYAAPGAFGIFNANARPALRTFKGILFFNHNYH
jgi:hypothetical protein